MKTYIREYGAKDYGRVMEFLSEVFLLNGSQHSWLPARWEYATYLVGPLHRYRGYRDWTETIRLWEDRSGEIHGIVVSENPDSQVFLQIHPGHRYLEEEMIDWAEKHLAVPSENGNEREIVIWTHDNDSYRRSLLTSKRYAAGETGEYLNWQDLDREDYKPELPEGFSLHSFEEGVDLEAKIDISTRAFDSDPFPVSVYRSMQSAPNYRPDLDLYVSAGDGTIASFCTVWLYEELDLGVFEPVGTNRDYRRLGLGRAVLIEGLRRLKELGVKRGYVNSYGEERKAFYNRAGFIDCEVFRPWSKKLISKD